MQEEKKYYTDKTLKCKTCGKDFVFTAAAQKVFADKGYGKPIRCFDCRAAKRLKNEEREAKRLEREKARNIDPNEDWYAWVKANWDRQLVLFGDKD